MHYEAQEQHRQSLRSGVLEIDGGCARRISCNSPLSFIGVNPEGLGGCDPLYFEMGGPWGVVMSP